PRGATLLVAGRDVVDAAPLDPPLAVGAPNRRDDGQPGPLARPAPARPAAAGGLTRSRIAEAGLAPQILRLDDHEVAVHADLLASRAQARVLPIPARLAIPDGPKALAQRPDLGARRADHQLGRIKADVAPSLAVLPVAPQRHAAR